MWILSVGLTVLFVGLKILDKIQWNWIFVISPLLIHFLIYLILIFTVGILKTILGEK